MSIFIVNSIIEVMRVFMYAFLLFASLPAIAQQRFLLFYGDKGQEAISYYNTAERLLSMEARARRTASGIPIDYYDLPVSEKYLRLLGDNGVNIIRSSRWLNASLVETRLQASDLNKLNAGITMIVPVESMNIPARSKFDEEIDAGRLPGRTAKNTALDYGLARQQDTLLGIEYLHDRGFTGTGVTVAIFDGGYTGIDTMQFFASFYNSNRIEGTYDFWDNGPLVYHKSSHGTACASKIIGNSPGTFIGMAPDANVLLAITDDVTMETHQDEFHFVAALEWADSLGADIISASIGYKNFDSGQYSYTYADMNGRTAISSIGCAIAASKGLLIVTAAGNSGSLCAPCDADSILCVGGAKANKTYDNVSSVGPSADGRRKPDVAALTINTFSIRHDGVPVTYGYGGTSSSTPLIAGLAICLKQAHPTAGHMQIMQAIRQSGHQSASPDFRIGHGVPNARRADSLLSLALGVETPKPSRPGTRLRTFPNPVHNVMYVEDVMPIKEVIIYSVQGHRLQSRYLNGPASAIDMSMLPAATYWIRINYANGDAVSLKITKL